jgi:acyl-CoA hydrolase
MRLRTRRYVTKAYLTFVAVDAHGKPRALPDPLELESEEDRRRDSDAHRRRAERLRAAGRR